MTHYLGTPDLHHGYARLRMSISDHYQVHDLALEIVQRRPYIRWDEARRRMIHALHRSPLVDLWCEHGGEIDRALAWALQR